MSRLIEIATCIFIICACVLAVTFTAALVIHLLGDLP